MFRAGAPTTAAGVVTEIGTTAALATLIQVATPSTTAIKVVAWGISLDGIDPVAAPGIVQLIDCDVGMSSAASLTPTKWGHTGQASLCVGGTGATASHDGAVTEGTITASQVIDDQELHDQTGYACWFPFDARPLVAVSRFLRLRITIASAVNSLPWIIWDE
jgi:hypothetical protein